VGRSGMASTSCGRCPAPGLCQRRSGHSVVSDGSVSPGDDAITAPHCSLTSWSDTDPNSAPSAVNDANAILNLFGRDDLVTVAGESVGRRRVHGGLIHLQPRVRRLGAGRRAVALRLRADRPVQRGEQRDRCDGCPNAR
jgi:hypothetical protein